MINLLPKEAVKEIKAGHNNTFLIKSIIFIGSMVIFLSIVSAGAYIYLGNAKLAAENSTSSTLIDTSYQKAKSEAELISANIAISQNIISQSVSYSKIILELAKILPTQTTISSLSIDENSINQPVTLKIYAKSESEVSKLKTNFNSSSIFTGYNVVSTTDKQTDLVGYPVAITVTVNINKGLAK